MSYLQSRRAEQRATRCDKRIFSVGRSEELHASPEEMMGRELLRLYEMRIEEDIQRANQRIDEFPLDDESF